MARDDKAARCSCSSSDASAQRSSSAESSAPSEPGSEPGQAEAKACSRPPCPQRGRASAPPRRTAAARVAARRRAASGSAWARGTEPRPRGQAVRVTLRAGAFAPPRPASRGTCSSEASRILQLSPSVVAAARI
eukprot:scaffold98994_cov63-Phaeocystis_antarctica.AAC.3